MGGRQAGGERVEGQGDVTGRGREGRGRVQADSWVALQHLGTGTAACKMMNIFFASRLPAMREADGMAGVLHMLQRDL